MFFGNYAAGSLYNGEATQETGTHTVRCTRAVYTNKYVRNWRHTRSAGSRRMLLRACSSDLK